jgi:hypothetical protein
MALHGNYSVLYKSAGSFRSGGATGLGLDRPNFNKSGPTRNRFTATGLDPITSHPLGTAPGKALVAAQKDGGIGGRNNIVGLGEFTGAGALGINIEGALAGVALLEAIGQLVVSAVATIDGVATVSGNVLAALGAAATLTAQGELTGAASALGWAISALQGEAATDFTPYGTGALAATIDVAAVTDLTAGAIADEILDAQMVETGLSVRETLRLCAAALAGKVSISGNTVTIRNAVADDTDRIVATTTTEGERTAITYDVG